MGEDGGRPKQSIESCTDRPVGGTGDGGLDFRGEFLCQRRLSSVRLVQNNLCSDIQGK